MAQNNDFEYVVIKEPIKSVEKKTIDLYSTIIKSIIRFIDNCRSILISLIQYVPFEFRHQLCNMLEQILVYCLSINRSITYAKSIVIIVMK